MCSFFLRNQGLLQGKNHRQSALARIMNETSQDIDDDDLDNPLTNLNNGTSSTSSIANYTSNGNHNISSSSNNTNNNITLKESPLY